MLNGALVDEAAKVPLTHNSTFRTATLSLAEKVTVTLPDTFVPSIGVRIEIDGGWVSGVGDGVGVEPDPDDGLKARATALAAFTLP